MTTDQRPPKFVYGPEDGGEVEEGREVPDLPAYTLCPLLVFEGNPVVAKYLPGTDETHEPGRRTFVFDGFYVNPPGPNFGPRLGGMKKT